MEKTQDELARSRVITKLKSERSKNNFDFEIERLKEKLLDSQLSHKAFNRILKSIDILQSASIAGSFLNVGDQAPDFELTNSFGRKMKLSQVVKEGKVILNFFRGGWCPYCYLELRALQKINNLVKQGGAQIISICPEKREECQKTMERNNLHFNILTDKGNKVSEKYRLISKNDTHASDCLLDIGFDSAIDNGDISYQLPVPAIFIVDEWMTIRFAYQDPDFTKRVDTQDILNCINNF